MDLLAGQYRLKSFLSTGHVAVVHEIHERPGLHFLGGPAKYSFTSRVYFQQESVEICLDQQVRSHVEVAGAVAFDPHPLRDVFRAMNDVGYLAPVIQYRGIQWLPEFLLKPAARGGLPRHVVPLCGHDVGLASCDHVVEGCP